ncbi:hypothetical protein Tco_0374266 [Tanacetum coccineum]
MPEIDDKASANRLVCLSLDSSVSNEDTLRSKPNREQRNISYLSEFKEFDGGYVVYLLGIEPKEYTSSKSILLVLRVPLPVIFPLLAPTPKVTYPPSNSLNSERYDMFPNQETEEVHATLTTEPPVVQQQSSSVSSDLVSKFINPSPDTGINSILNPNVQSDIPVNVSVSATTETPSSDTTIPQPPIPIIQSQQQTHDSTTTTTIPTTTFPEIPNFASLFGFEQRVSSLETELSELKQTNQFAKALSSISGIVDNYLASQMKDAVNVVVQLKSNNLREEAQAKNDEILKQIDSNIKAIIKDQVKAQVSKIMPKVEKYATKSLGAKVLARSSNQPQTSYAAAASLSEFEDEAKEIRQGRVIKKSNSKESKSTSSSKGASRSQPKSSGKSAQAEEHGPRVDDLEEPLHQEFNTGNDDVSPVREIIAVDERLWNPSGSQTPDREWNKTKTVDDRPPQSWMTQLAQASGTQSSFNEFLATPIDFSAFIMNRLKLNNLTQDVLTGPTYDLMKGTCKSVVELEYHLEEVFKATNDQLDWHNPEGRPYPHDLSKPLPLIQNARGRQVIPFDHFINNDLEYLKGGSLSQKYTTSLTKTKAADYGHVKWIEDKVPRSIWSPAQVVYDKHAYWGTYHWGPKRQRFYGYATNMETLKDVYLRHRIIVVTSLKIMEFFGYKHLEEIIVRRQDDQLYKFREGDFKRLRRQDIKDMLLLLVQGKLTNLNVDERFLLNVALRMYTRCIVIQECVEDLQLAVES